MRCPWKALAALDSAREDSALALPLAGGTVADVRDVRSWQAVASGEAELVMDTSEGPEPGSAALRLDFDFHGSGGFAVARREVRLRLPERFAVRFSFRGTGAVNDLEVKWVDAAGSSVWRHVLRLTAWPESWQTLELRDRDFPFAWGPAGGGQLREAGAVEIALVAREGGCGSLWVTSLFLLDQTVYGQPGFSASSWREGQDPALAGDPLTEAFWESAPDDPEPVWAVDWTGEREFGGLSLRWARVPARPFVVESSPDGQDWRELARVSAVAGRGTFLPFEGARARFLRLRFERAEGAVAGPVALASVELMPPEFGESRDAALHTIAAMAPRGWFPRYWLREQSYWTPVGPPGGAPRGLMNEEGLVEPGLGRFSLEPFFWSAGRLWTWADARLRHEQAGGWMPVPGTVWETGPWRLRIDGGARSAGSVVRYSLENTGGTTAKVRLFVALRPFQATPPWQSFRGFGGVGRLEELRREGDARVELAGGVTVGCEPGPDAFGVVGGLGGELIEVLSQGEVPRQEVASDRDGLLSGAFAWDLEMGAGEVRVVTVKVFSGSPAEDLTLEGAVQAWKQTEIGAPAWELRCGNEEAVELVRVMRGAAAHILVNRDGAALQPGPRRYQRCWIRDAAGMGRALLYAGCREEIGQLLDWYAPFVREDGTVPCCVDGDGPDWLPEHDSQGQFVHILAEYWRYGGDREVPVRLWPVALRTLERLAALRETRMTEAYRSGNPPHRYGLLPESASHEGYLAHPVHSYWDDFWALRGLRDGVWLAEQLGEQGHAKALRDLRDSFEETLAESLAGLVADRKLDFVPGSVEWADFDPSATAIGLALLDDLPGVSRVLLETTYGRYLEGFRQRRDGEVPWENYTPYEIRVIGAFVRLGWRAEAGELLRRFLDDRRPRAWNQWPEIAWRNPRAPGHLGDVPHTWIGAEYVAAARSLFVYERERDASLVLMAGVPAHWLRGPGGLEICDWPTACGPLRVAVELKEGEALLRLGAGLRMPPGGVVLSLPLPGRLSGFDVNGEAQPLPEDQQLRVRICPAEVRIRFAT